jgi:hypothetical protein
MSGEERYLRVFMELHSIHLPKEESEENVSGYFNEIKEEVKVS